MQEWTRGMHTIFDVWKAYHTIHTIGMIVLRLGSHSVVEAGGEANHAAHALPHTTDAARHPRRLLTSLLSGRINCGSKYIRYQFVIRLK